MSTHGPIERDLYAPMNTLARVLGQLLKPYGFALLVFPFGDDPKDRMNYISNARREDMIVALKELLARFEGQDIEPPASRQ